MKPFDWDKEKNNRLKIERDIGFEEIVVAIQNGNLLDIVPHYKEKRYPNQKIFILNINGYAYMVPFVEDEEKIFLKTIIPSRKATKKYLLGEK